MAKAITDRRVIDKVDGVRETLALLKGWPKEARKELSAEVQRMTGRHANSLAQSAQRSPDKRVKGMAQTVRAKKDRLPTVVIGGSKEIPVSRSGKGPRAGDIMYGTEFGARLPYNAWRFPPRSDSYWIYKTLKGRQAPVVLEWQQAVEKVARRWAQ